MVNKKRESIDIIFDMLCAIKGKGGEIKPTHLMYKANLAHEQLKIYLDDLIDKNLIKRIDKNGYEYLVITSEGLKFKQKIKEMKDFEKMFGF
ncbi:MAG TPA: winged helix-turn-helix domain-containing protein [Candidatus Woesearchaeota archaeon]|nr:winged helix-turn-helix domain-containing protein [Candidatus Woesearchaeota archaeon]